MYVPNHLTAPLLGWRLPRWIEVKINYPVPSGTRIDRYLAGRFPERARVFYAALARQGRVLANGRAVPPRYRVKTGDTLAFAAAEPEPFSPTPEPIPLSILREEASWMAIDKPAGLVVHPAKGHWSGTVVNAVLYHCGSLPGAPDRPGIVHRLDVETSGALLIAKTERALVALQRQFARRTVEKTYLAIVQGEPAREAGTIALPLGRSARDRKKVIVRRDAGARAAESRYRVVERLNGFALVEVTPQTGRMHQIRVHLAAIGHPVAGDKDYGNVRSAVGDQRSAMGRQALHAWKLRFADPETSEPVEVEAPLPEDMRRFLAAES